MGRHDHSDTATVAYGPSRGVIGGRHVAAEPSPRGVTIGGLDASTVAIIPAPAVGVAVGVSHAPMLRWLPMREVQ